MRQLGIAILTAGLVSTATVAAKPRPLVTLTRTGAWVVNYDDNACHLLGQFGDLEDGVVIRMTRYQPGDPFDLTLYGKPFDVRTLQVKVSLDFGVSDGPIERTGLAGKAGTRPMVLAGGMRIDGKAASDPDNALPPVDPSRERAAATLVVGFGGSDYRLETGPLDLPLAKLRECQTDLVKFWGYDPAVQAQLSRPAKPATSPARWATSSDFPRAALESGRSGVVKFRLDIDETGKVTKCAVLAQTSPTDFAKTSCDILVRRGKFQPALDKDGQPVRSFWVSSIRWMF